MTVRIFAILMLTIISIARPGVAFARTDFAGAVDPVAQVMMPVMAGEFALQAGKLNAAASWYLQAAEMLPDDPELAARTTRIAMLVNDDATTARALQLWRRSAPESLNMRGAEAAFSLRMGRTRKARQQLLNLLRDPDPRGWRFALLALMGARDTHVSARVLGSLVDTGAIPDDLLAWQEFGQLALRLEDPRLAGRIIDQVMRRFPNEPGIVLLRASQLHMDGDTEAARRLLAPLKPRAMLDEDIRKLLVLSYESMGDFQDGAEVMAMGAQSTLTYSIRASLLARANDAAGLERLYEELRRESVAPDANRRLLIGKIAEFLNRPEEAIGWYRSIDSGVQRTEARLRTANILHEFSDREAAFREIHALQSDATVNDTGRLNAYLVEAQLYQRDGDSTAEMDVLARGLAAYPDDQSLLYARALAWERRDQIDHAEADLRKILVSDPENIAALNALGYTLADRTDRYQEALELIGRARAASPQNAAIIDSYGWVLYRLGQYEDALIELKRAWSMMKDAEVAAHLGEVLWKMDRKEDALRYFGEAYKLDPQNRSLLRALEVTGASVGDHDQ